MAEIINYNPEDNPRLSEIYDILLLAGYFRIRIASLKAFDKVLGGMAWCITSSNFEISVDYNDEMQIGQKIKASEIICESLLKMKCPYSLQPFQLQGLDVNNIFPIVQWLIKFVYETRFDRQRYDKQLSLIQGRRITGFDLNSNEEKILHVPVQRARINRTIRGTAYAHPLRVYSTLLQFKDASATRMYNKLLNVIANEQKRGTTADATGRTKNIVEALGEDPEDEGKENIKGLNQFGNFSDKHRMSLESLDKLKEIIDENKRIIEEGIKDSPQIELNVEISETVEGQKQSQADKDGQMSSKNQEEHRLLQQMKVENRKFQQKIQILENQLGSFASLANQLEAEIARLQEKKDISYSAYCEQKEQNEQYREYYQQAEARLKESKKKIDSKIEKMVEERQNLKLLKAVIKKRAKAKIDELNYELQLAQSALPEIDEQAFKSMIEQAELKKSIYSKKYQELTLINQELAILQRKSENITSAPEIAQYHQRFVELFESINILIEQKRSLYSQISNLQSLKKVVANYLEIMNNMKSGYSEVRKKAELKEFNEDIREIVKGLEANASNSETTMMKIRNRRESVYAEYMDLIKLQRDYLYLLRLIKIEYENAAKYYK